MVTEEGEEAEEKEEEKQDGRVKGTRVGFLRLAFLKGVSFERVCSEKRPSREGKESMPNLLFIQETLLRPLKPGLHVLATHILMRTKMNT